jgi:ABC-type branched-subunit amino acid transport system ATPase component
MENRLDNVEEINSGNSCKLQSIMEMVTTLSQKVENVSVLIVESKKGLCAEQSRHTLNSESGEHSKMTRQEQIKESSVECNEHKETAVTSVKQSILKGNKYPYSK